ncbi:porin family protein [Hyalangium gracile]|uniref:porin family protein n=1 Tax=Hyalangium gracile TaxID=394092 RepID=UPI001CCF44D4|nr:porin family protein [Hyalangium gracile]
MKTKILVGAVAALLYGGVALAGDNKDCPPGYKMNDTQASVSPQTAGDESQTVIETQPVDDAIGGSGQVGMDQDLTVDEQAVDQDLSTSDQSSMDQGLGGSGSAGVNAQSGDILLRCQPVKSGAGTGGSGAINQDISSDLGAGGSGYQSEPLREPQVTPPAAPVTPVEPSPGAFTPITDDVDDGERKESAANMRGLTLMLGGGVEGYTGALAPEINPGPAYGVTASIKPSKVLGLELGYSGAVNNLDAAIGGAESGPDLVRNGGQAAVTLGLGAAPVQPYVLGGIGFSDYNFRGAAAGFDDDMVGNVPVGAGLRTHIGDFTADLRANYNFLFDQEFAAGIDEGLNENGRYSGTLNIGGTF